LEKLGLRVSYEPSISREELLERVGDFDVLIVRSRTRVDAEVLRRAAKLKVVARAGVGLDNIDVEEALKRGLLIVCAPKAPVQSVAELTIGLMIAAARRLYEACDLVKRGGWSKLTGVELCGKTLGVVGFGRVGSRVAEIAKAIGMRVLAYDVVDVKERASKVGVEVAPSLDELLRESDVVSLHVPLTKETFHMIGQREFEIMKDGAILVNTARGAVVDTKALLEALESGKVFAAALDVLEHEPPKEPWEVELVKHPRVIVTPHIGSQTHEAQRRIAENLLEELEAALYTLKGARR